ANASRRETYHSLLRSRKAYASAICDETHALDRLIRAPAFRAGRKRLGTARLTPSFSRTSPDPAAPEGRLPRRAPRRAPRFVTRRRAAAALLLLQVSRRHVRRIVRPLHLGPHVDARLESPPFRGLLERVLVSAFPVHDVAACIGVVRELEQRGR